MFDPDTARFLTPDPIGFDAGDPNLYRYCTNDPVNHTDPSGMTPENEACRTSLSAKVPTWFRDNVTDQSGKCVVTWEQFKKALSCRKQLLGPMNRPDQDLCSLFGDIAQYSDYGDRDVNAIDCNKRHIDLHALRFLLMDPPHRDSEANIAVVQGLLDQCNGGLLIPNLREPILALTGAHNPGGPWIPANVPLPLRPAEPAGVGKPDCPMLGQASPPPTALKPDLGPVCMPLCPPGEEWRNGTMNRILLARQSSLFEFMLGEIQRWRLDPQYSTNATFAQKVEAYAELAMMLKAPRLQSVGIAGLPGNPPIGWRWFFEEYDAPGPTGPLRTRAEKMPQPLVCLPAAKSLEEILAINFALRVLATQIAAIRQDTPQNWSKKDTATKIIEAMRRAAPLYPAKVANRILEIVGDPATYAYLTGFLVFAGGAHYLGVGWVADAAAAALLGLVLGKAAIKVGEYGTNFILLAMDAKSDDDIDKAAEQFALALVSFTEGFVAGVTAKNILSNIKSGRGVPPSSPALLRPPVKLDPDSFLRPPTSSYLRPTTGIPGKTPYCDIPAPTPTRPPARPAGTPMPVPPGPMPVPMPPLRPIPMPTLAAPIKPPQSAPSVNPSTVVGGGVAAQILTTPSPGSGSGGGAPASTVVAAAEENDKEDKCRTLTGFTKGPPGIQQRYATILRSVNRKPQYPENQERLLRKFNMHNNLTTVTVPTLVAFRIDPDVPFPLPGGESSTKGVVASYRDVVGAESAAPVSADTAGHVINWRFGGKSKSALGWILAGDTNIIPIGGAVNAWYTQADDEIWSAITAKPKKLAACARITIEYEDDDTQIPYPARPKRILYELYTQLADGTWQEGRDSKDKKPPFLPYGWWPNVFNQPPDPK